MSDTTIRPYEPGDEEQILDLFNRVFSEDNPDFEPRDMATWRHIYEGNPCGHQTLVGVDGDGRIVANYSSCPVKVRARGEDREATQVVDSCVDARFRALLGKKSLFIRIAHEYQRLYCDPEAPAFNDYIYGLPNERAYPIGRRMLGYTPVHCPLPRQVRVFDERWSDELAARAGGLTAEAAGWEVLPTLVKLFEQHSLPRMELGNHKTLEYLQWRYRDWPGAPYRLAVVHRDGAPAGAVVYRVGVPWETEKLVVALDWFGPGDDEHVVAALMSHLAAAGWDEGHPRFETWTTPAMPHRAQILDLGTGEDASRFNLCMVLFSPRYDIPWVKDHWWLTMGDTDIY